MYLGWEPHILSLKIDYNSYILYRHIMDKARFYERATPEVGEIVFAKVKAISEVSVICELIEYGYIEAIIPLTELSKRRIHSIRGLVRIGKVEPAVVLRNENGFIDLSKKKVDKTELQKAETRFHMTKKLISAVYHYSEMTGKKIQDLLERIVYTYKYQCLDNTNATADELEFLRKKLDVKTKYMLRSIFNASYYGAEGIELLKTILSSSPYTVRYLSAPSYSMEYECTNEAEGYTSMVNEMNRMKAELEMKGGHFEIKAMPSTSAPVDELEDESEDDFENMDEQTAMNVEITEHET